jgi:hypothetical protein
MMQVVTRRGRPPLVIVERGCEGHEPERWREGADLKLESECVTSLADLKAAAEWAE